MIRVQRDPFEPGALLDAFMQRAGEGAVASFVGVVRGEGIDRLTLDHYPGFTEKQLERICAEVRDAFALTAIGLVHRHGAMAPGAPIMFAATSAPHRRAALDALDELMERLKHDAPFWKNESGPRGEHWLDPPRRESE
ncbi:molybdenum cofactor biosynthesis protein MoaE [Sphingomicrobium sp. XHP0235]|uniref:molybdenum cofactor biosynthesis protein MoaE n=1 Tax=Sphingomicrobium aquimarinum TaxID=3133971 RepID=UPI0031FE6B05